MPQQQVAGEDDQKADEDSDEDLINPRNYVSGIYSNNDFMDLKKQLESDIVQQAKDEVDRRHFIDDVDKALADLEDWNHKRKQQQQLKKPEVEEPPEEEVADDLEIDDFNFRGIDPELQRLHQQQEVNRETLMKQNKIRAEIDSGRLLADFQTDAINQLINKCLKQKQSEISYIADRIYEKPKQTPSKISTYDPIQTFQHREQVLSEFTKCEDDVSSL